MNGFLCTSWYLLLNTNDRKHKLFTNLCGIIFKLDRFWIDVRVQFPWHGYPKCCCKKIENAKSTKNWRPYLFEHFNAKLMDLFSVCVTALCLYYIPKKRNSLRNAQYLSRLFLCLVYLFVFFLASTFVCFLALYTLTLDWIGLAFLGSWVKFVCLTKCSSFFFL